jgi:hypothetical protein
LPEQYCDFVNKTPVCVFQIVWETSIDFSQDTNKLLDKRIGIIDALVFCALGEARN